MNSNTLRTISNPVGICHINNSTFSAFNAICRFLAVSFPFCMAGTSAAAAAHKTVIAALNNQIKIFEVLVNEIKLKQIYTSTKVEKVVSEI